jgi:hypothetical protein
MEPKYFYRDRTMNKYLHNDDYWIECHYFKIYDDATVKIIDLNQENYYMVNSVNFDFRIAEEKDDD